MIRRFQRRERLVSPTTAAKRARASFLVRMRLVLADVAIGNRSRESAIVSLERYHATLHRDFALHHDPHWSTWNSLGPDRDLTALRAANDPAKFAALVERVTGQEAKYV